MPTSPNPPDADPHPRQDQAPSEPAAEPLLATARAEVRALVNALRPAPEPVRPLFANSARRWVRKLPYAVALIFVVILLPITATLLVEDYGVVGGLAVAIAALQTTPLILAVTRPLPAWWIVIAADAFGALLVLSWESNSIRSWPWPPTVIVGYLVLCLGLSLRSSRRTSLAVWLVTVGVSTVLSLFSRPSEHSPGNEPLLAVLSGVVLLAGALARERGEAQRRLAEQETISEVERARRTMLEERTRIARELHDVVAHHMSVITVQADSAPYRLDGLPPEAEREFGTIAATARESLTEMRRLLGVLRSDNTSGERAPQPGLERLDQLVDATVRAGVPAQLSVRLERTTELPQALGLSAYRIVQEALANVVRHAPGAATDIEVEESAGWLDVRVVNGPSPEPDGAALETAGTGHGLVGMRERVRLVGGELATGPLADGGFRVAARLPVGDAEGEGPGRLPPQPTHRPGQGGSGPAPPPGPPREPHGRGGPQWTNDGTTPHGKGTGTT